MIHCSWAWPHISHLVLNKIFLHNSRPLTDLQIQAQFLISRCSVFVSITVTGNVIWKRWHSVNEVHANMSIHSNIEHPSAKLITNNFINTFQTLTSRSFPHINPGPPHPAPQPSDFTTASIFRISKEIVYYLVYYSVKGNVGNPETFSKKK